MVCVYLIMFIHFFIHICNVYDLYNNDLLCLYVSIYVGALAPGLKCPDGIVVLLYIYNMCILFNQQKIAILLIIKQTYYEDWGLNLYLQ